MQTDTRSRLASQHEGPATKKGNLDGSDKSQKEGKTYSSISPTPSGNKANGGPSPSTLGTVASPMVSFFKEGTDKSFY